MRRIGFGVLLVLALLRGAGAAGVTPEHDPFAGAFSGVAVWERGEERLVVSLAVGTTPQGPYRWSSVEGETERVTLCWQSICRSYLPSDGVVFIDRADEVWAGMPVRARPRTWVAEHYAIKPLPEQVRWGRVLVGQRLVPRDNWRYPQRWWIDRASGVVVERQIETADGAPLERLVMVRFSPQEALSSLAVRQKWVALGRLPAVDLRLMPLAPEQMPAVLAALPPGFRLLYCGVRQGPSGQPVWQWVVGDEVVRLSLFAEAVGPRGMEEASAAQTPTAVERVGATAIVRQVRDGWGQTAVGEVPEATLRALLDALRWQRRGEGG